MISTEQTKLSDPIETSLSMSRLLWRFDDIIINDFIKWFDNSNPIKNVILNYRKDEFLFIVEFFLVFIKNLIDCKEGIKNWFEGWMLKYLIKFELYNDYSMLFFTWQVSNNLEKQHYTKF